MISPMYENHAGCSHIHFPSTPVRCLLFSSVLSALCFFPLNAYGSSVSTPRLSKALHLILLTLGHTSDHPVFRYFCGCIVYVFLQF